MFAHSVPGLPERAAPRACAAGLDAPLRRVRDQPRPGRRARAGGTGRRARRRHVSPAGRVYTAAAPAPSPNIVPTGAPAPDEAAAGPPGSWSTGWSGGASRRRPGGWSSGPRRWPRGAGRSTRCPATSGATCTRHGWPRARWCCCRRSGCRPRSTPVRRTPSGWTSSHTPTRSGSTRPTRPGSAWPAPVTWCGWNRDRLLRRQGLDHRGDPARRGRVQPPHGPVAAGRRAARSGGMMATVGLCHGDDGWRMERRGPAGPYSSADPDSQRIWWNDTGVHQNLTFSVHPDPISGMHCWHQAVRVSPAAPDDRHGDIAVDTGRAHEVYQRWLLHDPPGGPGFTGRHPAPELADAPAQAGRRGVRDPGGSGDGTTLVTDATAPPAAGRWELFRALGAVAGDPADARTACAALGWAGPDNAEHTEVFVLNCPPYAAVYLGAEGGLGGDAADRAAGFWRAIGLAPPGEPDHLTALSACTHRSVRRPAMPAPPRPPTRSPGPGTRCSGSTCGPGCPATWMPSAICGFPAWRPGRAWPAGAAGRTRRPSRRVAAAGPACRAGTLPGRRWPGHDAGRAHLPGTQWFHPYPAQPGRRRGGGGGGLPDRRTALHPGGAAGTGSAAPSSWLAGEATRWSRRHAAPPAGPESPRDIVQAWWARRAGHTARILAMAAAGRRIQMLFVPRS